MQPTPNQAPNASFTPFPGFVPPGGPIEQFMFSQYESRLQDKSAQLTELQAECTSKSKDIAELESIVAGYQQDGIERELEELYNDNNKLRRLLNVGERVFIAAALVYAGRWVLAGSR